MKKLRLREFKSLAKLIAREVRTETGLILVVFWTLVSLPSFLFTFFTPLSPQFPLSKVGSRETDISPVVCVVGKWGGGGDLG